MQEIKFRLENWKEMESLLAAKGASYQGASTVCDTYFNQRLHYVLKVQESDGKAYLVELHPEHGGFKLVRFEEIGDTEQTKRDLELQFGIFRILHKKMHYYSYRDAKISFNLIEGVGDFLVWEADTIEPSLVEMELELTAPEYIRVPFSELA